MSFLNPLLLLGALGVGLPILAHLFNRYQVKQTDWAAMRFLNRSVRVRSRQLRLKDILLLLLRCLAILLFCLALARPAITGNRAAWLGGERRAGVVVAVDASYSMHHGDDRTRFERAVQRAEAISAKIEPGDPVTLVMLAGEHRVAARNMAFNRERFRALLASRKPVPEMLDLESVPGRLRELTDDIDALQKEVYIITDVQARDWSEPSAQLHNAFEELGQGVSVFLVPVQGQAENLAVTGLELVSGVLRRGAIARYRATVKNVGMQPASSVRVIGRVEGNEIDSKVIPRIAPGAAESVSLFVPFHNAGPQHVNAELPDDSLPEDNVRRTVSVVRDTVSVLCVDGSSGEAGALLVAALQAHDRSAGDDNYTVRSISWLGLPSAALNKVDVLVLADVPELTPRQADRLKNFVRRGNGLIWFAGPNVDAANWNEHAGTGAGALLPARMGSVVSTGDSLGAGRPLDSGMPKHAVLRPLRSLPADLFNETRFLKHVQVTPRASSIAVLTLAARASPMLLEHALGRGHVFMFASSAGPAWNNMAATPVFPMLLQQMVTYLAGREFEESKRVGDTLALWYAAQPDASDAVFESPSGRDITVPVRQHGNRYVALLEKADEAGYYMARVSVQAPGMPVAVNVDTSESDVTCLADAGLKDAWRETGMTIATTGTDLVDAIDRARTGRSLWRLFMLAALLLLMLEALLADRMHTNASPAGRGATERDDSRSGPTDVHHSSDGRGVQDG